MVKKKNRKVDEKSSKTLGWGTKNSCLYCEDQWVANAPKDKEHFKVVEAIGPGSKLEFFSWKRGLWKKGEEIQKFNKDVWEIRCADDPEIGPDFYHLPHFRIRIVQCSRPRRSQRNRNWREAQIVNVREEVDGRYLNFGNYLSLII